MPAESKATSGGPQRHHPKHDHRIRSAMDRYESEERFWLFLSAEGVLWLRAKGQAAARLSAGPVNPQYCLHTENAATALRLAEMKSEQTGLPIVDESGLRSLAKENPEADHGAKRAHAERKDGRK